MLQSVEVLNVLYEYETRLSPRALPLTAWLSGNPLGCSRLREGPPAGDPEAAAAGLGKKRGWPVSRQHSGAAHSQCGSGNAGKALRQPRRSRLALQPCRSSVETSF